MHTESAVADGLAALERHLSAWSTGQAVLTFGPLSGAVAAYLRSRGVGASICELGNATTGGMPPNSGWPSPSSRSVTWSLPVSEICCCRYGSC